MVRSAIEQASASVLPNVGMRARMGIVILVRSLRVVSFGTTAYAPDVCEGPRRGIIVVR